MIGFRPSRLKRLPTPTLDLPDCGMSSRDCEKTDKHHGREYSHRIYNDEGWYFAPGNLFQSGGIYHVR